MPIVCYSIFVRSVRIPARRGMKKHGKTEKIRVTAFYTAIVENDGDRVAIFDGETGSFLRRFSSRRQNH